MLKVKLILLLITVCIFICPLQTFCMESVSSDYERIADLFYKQNDYTQAKNNYEKLIRTKSTINTINSKVYLHLGRSYYALGNIHKAIQYYKDGLSLKPDDNDLHCALGAALLTINQASSADMEFNKVDLLAIDDPETYAEVGLYYALNHSYDKAEQNFLRAIALDKNNGSYFTAIGLINLNKYSYCGNPIIYFRKAANIDKKLKVNYPNLLLTYGNLYGSTINSINQTIESHKREFLNNRNYNCLGYIYLKANLWDESIESFKKINNDYSAQEGLAFAQTGKNEFLFLLNNPTAKNKIASLYLQRAHIYRNINKLELAAQNKEKAIKLNNNLTNLNIDKNSINITQKEDITTNETEIIKPKEPAPENLLKLVKLQRGIKENYRNRTFTMLRFLWNDPEGKILLNIIMKNKIPIIIVKNINETQTEISSSQIVFRGISPRIHTFDKNVEIQISSFYIDLFYSRSFNYKDAITSFEVFIHEICHAVARMDDEGFENSLEEELTASMIGYNVASRILLNKELTQEETGEYSKKILISLLTDKHRFLPVFGSFNQFILKLGINPPYFYMYSDVPQLYAVIRSSTDKTIPALPQNIMF